MLAPLPGEDEAPDPLRRLVAAVLLRACLDAHAGQWGARLWLESDQAYAWAEALGLAHWPPRLDQLDTRRDLQRRAMALQA